MKRMKKCVNEEKKYEMKMKKKKVISRDVSEGRSEDEMKKIYEMEEKGRKKEMKVNVKEWKEGWNEEEKMKWAYEEEAVEKPERNEILRERRE